MEEHKGCACRRRLCRLGIAVLLMVLAGIGWLGSTGGHGSVSRAPGEDSGPGEGDKACAAQDGQERSSAPDNESALTVEEKLEYVEEHFSFESFVEDPLGCIRGMEERDVFEVVSIPRQVLVHVGRRWHKGPGRGQAWGFLDELRDVERADARRSFDRWKSTIKETIKTGGRRIAVARSSLMDRVSRELLGPCLRSLLLADEGRMAREASGESGIEEAGTGGSHSGAQAKCEGSVLTSSQ